jgi:hypothetical protein
MKKTFFITLFIVTHIGFFVLQIQKQIVGIKESLHKQKNERTLMELHQQKETLMNELQMVQSKHIVKKEAEKTFNLKPIKLSQIRQLSHDKE